MIKNLFDYYLANQADLVEKYNGKYIVITKDGVAGAFDSDAEGYYVGKEKFGLGNFIVQLCTPGEDAYSQQFFSPIAAF